MTEAQKEKKSIQCRAASGVLVLVYLKGRRAKVVHKILELESLGGPQESGDLDGAVFTVIFRSCFQS